MSDPGPMGGHLEVPFPLPVSLLADNSAMLFHQL